MYLGVSVCVLFTLKISFLDSGTEIEIGFPSFQKYGQTHKMQVRNKQPLMLSMPKDPVEKKEEDL